MFVEPQHQPITTKPADPFTLPALIAWLETMPGDGVYCFVDNGECLLAQYFAANGYKNINMGPYDFEHGRDCTKVSLPRAFNDIANDDDMTFGAALTRARQALADQVFRALADDVRA